MDLKQLEQRLTKYGQQHVLTFWDQLEVSQQENLAQQLEQLDLAQLQQLLQESDSKKDWADLAQRSVSPPAIRLGKTPEKWTGREALEAGEAALRAGKIAVVVVAGGQGTRLGFDDPKGMFPIGPLSQRTLFEMHFDRIQAVAARYEVPLVTYVMTSPATDAATRDYIRQQDYFGMDRQRMVVFQQGTMPAVDAHGKLLLANRDSLALSPDGHGGMLQALDRCGALQRMQRDGVEHLFYFQVDNPLVRIADPVFIGHHLLEQSELTSQVVAKQSPDDKVGNVVSVDGQVMVIEYSDLPAEAAGRRDAEDNLMIWAGSIAVHMFDVAFLSRMLSEADALPFHYAHKKVPYVDLSSGEVQEPAEPNATKFERFIFDLLPKAARPLVVEVEEADAFAPLKNAPGADKDTPEYVQRFLIERDRRMLQQAGIRVAPDVKLEVHPQWALDSADILARHGDLASIEQDTYLR